MVFRVGMQVMHRWWHGGENKEGQGRYGIQSLRER